MASTGVEPYSDLEQRGHAYNLSHIVVANHLLADTVDAPLAVAMARAVLEMET